MKILAIMFLVFFIWFILLGDIKVNKIPVRGFFNRLFYSFIGSAILTIFIGLPILGIISLIK